MLLGLNFTDKTSLLVPDMVSCSGIMHYETSLAFIHKTRGGYLCAVA